MRIVDFPDLSRRTTLRMGGTGLAEIILEKERDFDFLSKELPKIGGIPLGWGQGSNILPKDGRQPLVLISPYRSGPTVKKKTAESVLVRASGGVRMAGLLRWCAGQGFSGLENMAGIPGTLGGAVRMNAGSFGTQTSDLLQRVRIWTEETGLIWVDKVQWTAGYRRFLLPEVKGFFLVVEAELRLGRGDPVRIKEDLRRTYFQKKGSQPVAARTCGCVFKNPTEGEPAGRLLEQAGFRGKSRGGAGFSDKHANFLVNAGGGTSSQALELIEEAREAVQARFGTELELELKVVP